MPDNGYLISQEDISSISQALDFVTTSNLILDRVFDKIRFVTFDSENLFVFTRGEHFSTETTIVEQLSCPSTQSFKLFKIKYDGSIGSDERDYKGGRAWLLRPELENTASEADKFPNMYADDEKLGGAGLILDAVKIPPPSHFNEIQQGKYDYLTDVLFHETGHIEHRRIIDWRPGKPKTEYFPTPDAEKQFKELVIKGSDYGADITSELISCLDNESFSEMYPMLIDREAARKYCPDHLRTVDQKLDVAIIKADNFQTFGKHEIGHWLACSLEQSIPNFKDRKEKIVELLNSSDESKPAKKIRAVGIVIRGDEVLMIHRRNKEEYYVFPGGKVEEGETVGNAVLRELKEETSIEATIDKFLYRLSYYEDGSEHQFYLCHYVSGEPKLSEDSNEKKEMESGEEFYEPMWVKLNELKNLKIYPPEVPGWILRDFSDLV